MYRKEMRVREYPWNESDKSAKCRVRRAGASYYLYVGDLPDIRSAAWFLRKGKRVIASGITSEMPTALAQVEHAFENWTSNAWRVHG
ncbi:MULTISPECIES: hypothetical protein [Rhizobiaceae]|uniref:Uncharacterized protein n=1 Tax=Mycoplana rhizolycopersici TaxID=2746702 RepID=A0ABX2QAJ4_9HYPH|nr:MULTISPECIES: hypothetical protein [Rhizobium/Agrobacterium group]NVP54743.1 hypothetical protein [Rhizobium rhizolycopersici]TQN60085.1 hypothetical protein FLX27_17145 [Agrobacterium tumefaciens]